MRRCQIVGFGLVADVVLRSAAHTGASIVAKVPNGQRLKIFGTQGEYIEVDWCGTHGFVKMGNVVPVREDIGGGPVADDNQHSPDRPAVQMSLMCSQLNSNTMSSPSSTSWNLWHRENLDLSSCWIRIG